MKTYCDHGYRYFFDTTLRMWTIYAVDEQGEQSGGADYAGNRALLLQCYPELSFTLES